jgi:hypothetical protein
MGERPPWVREPVGRRSQGRQKVKNTVGQLDYAKIQTDLIRMCEEVVACKNLPLVDGLNPKLAVAMATLLGWAYQQDEHLMASNEALAIKLGTLEQKK